MAWEWVVLLVLFKIPIAYVCWVVYWAIRAVPAPPEPLEGAELVPTEELPPGPSDRLRRRFRRPRPRGGPHGGFGRGYARSGRIASVKAER